MSGFTVFLFQQSNAETKQYEIGDIGPGGGIVFYDKGKRTYGWRYLAAAPEDQSSGTAWGCYGKGIPGKQKESIGTGKSNTMGILRACKDENSAARIASSYSGGGKEDWYLPSKDELNEMYEKLHKAGLGNFANYGYWSSTEDSKNPKKRAWYHGFITGSQKSFNKYNSSRVRAIRAF